MPPYPSSEGTPSWIRAPPESLIEMKGFRAATAMSITFQIFFACISPRLPPALVKSWAAAKTVRPLIRPKPVTTPSPGISFSPETEERGTVLHEELDLLERPRIEERIESLPGRELARAVLLLDQLLAAHRHQGGLLFSSNSRIFSAVERF